MPIDGRSRIALGTAQFGMVYGIANDTGQVTGHVARQMLALAAASGIDTVDTAASYGDSESCLGAIGVNGFRVVTKLPGVPAGIQDVGKWVRDIFAASLGRLTTRHVYALLLHRTADLHATYGSALYEALLQLKQAGLVQKIGISIYSPSELTALDAFRFDLVQAPFNVVDRRLQTSGWLDRLKGREIEVHARSPFLQGLLVLSPGRVPRHFRRWSALWDLWRSWLEEHQLKPIEGCLQFVLGHLQVDRVVVGADSVRQLEEIVVAAMAQGIRLPDSLQCDDEELVNPSRWPSR